MTRSLKAFVCVFILPLVFITSFALPALAQPSSFLELDGNIRDGSTLEPPYDWGHSGGSSGDGGVFDGGTSAGTNTPPNAPSRVITHSSVIDTAFIVDSLASDENTCGTLDGDSSVYTGAGGEKNGDRFSTMTWGVGSIPPNKNDLSNVYALARQRTEGTTEVFFAAERSDNNGDSHIDFEFLQDQVAKTGACSGGFTGNRTSGDLLIAVDLTNGGEQPTGTIYRWTCVPAETIGTTCNPPATGSSPAHHYAKITTISATVQVNEDGPVACGGWICRDSSGASVPSVPTNDFIEGGLVLEEAGFTGCVSTFMPHTRTSQEFGATLKDFIPPVSFDSCKAPDVTTRSNPDADNVVPGTAVRDVATVGLAGDAVTTGTVDFYLCQPGAVTAAGCPAPNGSKIGATKSLDAEGTATSDSTSNTAAIGTYCWRAEYKAGLGTHLLNTSHTNADTECFTTVKQPSRTTTTSNPTGGNLVPGSPASDTAIVSGDGDTPTGTVTFYLCQPGAVTGAGCPAGGAQVGSPVALNGDGEAASATTTNTTAVGSYCWRAEYSGNGYYVSSTHTNATTECFTTVKQPSEARTTAVIAQTLTPAGDHVVPGTSVADLVVVNGSDPVAGGYVTFFLCGPDEVDSGCPAESGTQVGVAKLLDAEGTATSDATADTLAIGTYCWRAEYSGDEYYEPSNHTNATSECFTIVRQPSSTSTQSRPSGGGVVPGTSASDSATVTGDGPAPTGTVTFFLCGPADVTETGCPEGGTQAGNPVSLANGTAVSSSTNDTRTAGTYCWRAEYSGDGYYLASAHTNASSECFTTSLQTSSTSTQSRPSGGGVVPGASASDSATVTGDGPAPTGTVTFFLCGPADVIETGCPENGTQVGVPIELDGGIAVSASTIATTAIGTYCWRAEYSGDWYYTASTHTDDSAECFTTVKQSSAATTVSTPNGGDVVPGSSAFDTALVLGDGRIPTGTLTFFLCGPGETGEGGCVDGGTQVGDPVELVLGGANSSATTATTDVGAYCWRVEYSGDDYYLASSHTDAVAECFTTVKQTTVSSTTSTPTGPVSVNGGQSVVASDTATVTGGEGLPVPSGVVAFFLCGPIATAGRACEEGGSQVGSAVNLQDGKASSDVITVTTAGRYCWRAEYSGDDLYFASSHTNTTTECFSVSVVLGVQLPGPPLPGTGSSPFEAMPAGIALIGLGFVFIHRAGRRGRRSNRTA